MSEDLREAISAAFDKSEETTEAVVPSAHEGEPPAHEEAAESAEPVVRAEAAEPAEQADLSDKEKRERDEAGRFAAKKAKPVQQASSAAPVPKATDAVPPPRSWKLPVREAHWNSLPPEVKAEVVRRERETSAALAESAEARKFHASFDKMAAPYMGMIRGEGSDPLTATEEMFKVAWVLRAAPPATKAQAVAQLIRQFGVPIEQLDQALVGNAHVQPQHAPVRPQEFRDPRVDQMLAQRAQSAAREAGREVEEFGAKHEFFDNLRDSMAEIIGLRSARGAACSLEDAYKIACQADPEVSAVLAQRQAAKQTNGAGKARAASSSLRPATSAVTKAPRPVKPGEDRRNDILAAWEEVANRGS